MISDNKSLRRTSIFKKLLERNELGAILPLVILLIIVAFVNPTFFRSSNVMDILRTSSYTMILAVPLTFMLSSRNMDLTIGATTSIGGVVCAMALKAGMPVGVAIGLGLLTGVGIGLINGLVVVKLRLPSMIATLGMQYIINGITSITTNNLAISGFSDGFKVIAQGKLFGAIHYTIIYALIIGIIGYITLNMTKYGRSILAIGGNDETAHLAGIRVNAIQISTYVLTSFFAALVGILYASRFASAQPSAGSGSELMIMAGVMIGGTSMFGGSGTVVGSAFGCILMAMIQNALIIMKVSTLWQNLIFGIILLISIYIDKIRRRAGGE